MAARFIALTDDDYERHGARHATPDVTNELTDVRARWQTDAPRLGPYGYGPSKLAELVALEAEHAAAIATRPELVAQKSVSVAARNRAIESAWVWVGKATNLLGSFARGDAELATKLAEATPTETKELDAKVPALEGLLAARAPTLSPEARAETEIEARIGEAAAVLQGLKEASLDAAAAKSATPVGMREINIIEGKIATLIRDFNTAARKAIAAGVLTTEPDKYKFTYLAPTPTVKTPADPAPAG